MPLTKQDRLNQRREELRKVAGRLYLAVLNADFLKADPLDSAEAHLEHWLMRNVQGEWGADLCPMADENYPDA